MKQLKLAFVLILTTMLSSQVFGIGHYQIGDTLYCIAKSGLNIREQPTLTSTIVDVATYGNQVIALAERHPFWHGATDSIKIMSSQKWHKQEEETLSHWIRGRWVKIKFKDQEGFVFDGYLSRQPPFLFDKDGNIEGLEEYVKRNFELREQAVDQYQFNPEYRVDTKRYENGCIIESGMTSKSGWTTIYIYGFSIEELMLHTSYLNENPQSDDSVFLIKADQEKNEYYFEGEISGIFVRALGGMLMVSYSGWC